jgi:hypothetical protein
VVCQQKEELVCSHYPARSAMLMRSMRRGGKGWLFSSSKPCWAIDTRMLKQAAFPEDKLQETKEWADQLGDLIYYFHSAGHREVSGRHLPAFLNSLQLLCITTSRRQQIPFTCSIIWARHHLQTRLCLQKIVLCRVRRLCHIADASSCGPN